MHLVSQNERPRLPLAAEVIRATFERRDLSAIDKVVACWLAAKYADHASGACWPSNERIARELNRSVRVVQRSLAALERVGILHRETVQVDPGGGKRLFTLLRPPADLRVVERGTPIARLLASGGRDPLAGMPTRQRVLPLLGEACAAPPPRPPAKRRPPSTARSRQTPIDFEPPP